MTSKDTTTCHHSRYSDNGSILLESKERLVDAADFQACILGDCDGFAFLVLLEIGKHGFLNLSGLPALAGRFRSLPRLPTACLDAQSGLEFL
jgi:hypothetical protein